MKTITLYKNDIHKGSLILVNKFFPIVRSEDDILMRAIDDDNQDIYLESTTAAVLSHMFITLNCQENIVPISGYRSFKKQQSIYEKSLRDNGREFTEKYVALPNHSEHQTGLAVDLALKRDNIDFICPDFPYQGICNDFRNKAPLYGFIERYQKGKEEITGIGHEPWHFRYVGYPHSLIMNKYNLVLEEYIDLIRLYPYKRKHYLTYLYNQAVEIFYVDTSYKSIELPEDAIHQISGNNVDGFIVTLWR